MLPRATALLVLLVGFPVFLSAAEGGAGVVTPAVVSSAVSQDEPELTGRDIVQKCGYKNPGTDQRAKFTVLLRDAGGNVKRSEYLRLWKDYAGVNDVANKMLLFAEYPPDAKGSAFMRVEYMGDKKRSADQWIYLPVLRKIRRVSIRDLSDSFLNSELTYADVSLRSIDDDEHTYIGSKKVKGLEFYIVESTPKESSGLYSKRIMWYKRAENWDECVNVRVDYYAISGSLLKEQFIKWQKVNDAWVWDRVLVRNRSTGRASVFQLSDVAINSGLDDATFSERSLRLGPNSFKKK